MISSRYNYPQSRVDGSISFRAIDAGAVAHIEDAQRTGCFDTSFAASAGFNHLMGVPIWSRGTIWGVIGLGLPAGKRPSGADIDLIEIFADQASIAIGHARLFAEVTARTEELTEALEQQTATADLLKAISQSVFGLPTVLQAVIETAARLCEAEICIVFNRIGDAMHMGAQVGCPPEMVAFHQANPNAIDRTNVAGRAALDRATIHVPDITQDADCGLKPSFTLGGWRSIIAVALLREGEAIGVLALSRRKVGPFSARQIELVESFAAQAVIALNNAQLFDELQRRTAEVEEALEQQKASAEILAAISQSVENTAKVFETILDKALRLAGCKHASLYLLSDDGQWLDMVAQRGDDPETADYFARMRSPATDRDSSFVQAIERRAPVHILDARDTDRYRRNEGIRRIAVDMGGIRTILQAPLMSGARGIGVLSVHRPEVRAFGEDEIALLETFAAQAVIAIENLRQFRELQRRTTEVEEALEQQKASAETLGVISRSVEDTAPVFRKILDSCRHLFGGKELDVLLIDESGLLQVAAYLGQYEKELLETFRAPWAITPAGEAIRTGRVANYADCANNPDTPPVLRKMARIASYHSVAFAPMMWEGKGIGAVGVARAARPFTDRELRIVQGFADQAVIAIQNARLFKETQTALVRQTASADILRVISGAQTDTAPVFEAILSRAAALCDAPMVSLNLVEDDRTHARFVAHVGDSLRHLKVGETLWPLDSGLGPAEAITLRKSVHILDLKDTDRYRDGESVRRAIVDKEGIRTFLTIPLVRNGEGIGCIALYRRAVKPFGSDDIALLETFAAQAVIAIENWRQFREVQARLARERATRQILEVISQSRDDDGPVFDAILRRAAELCDANAAALILARAGDTHQRIAAFHGADPATVEEHRRGGAPMDPDMSFGARAILTGEVVHVDDLIKSETYNRGVGLAVSSVQDSGIRSIMWVPLLTADGSIGAFSLFRKVVRPFSADEIALVEGFAAQAVIAIENVRQFCEVQQRLEREKASRAARQSGCDGAGAGDRRNPRGHVAVSRR